MSDKNTESDINYRVVMNHEEQYSIWPDFKNIPEGWTDVGFKGTKDACLERIRGVWTDMRPLSLRRAMDGAAS